MKLILLLLGVLFFNYYSKGQVSCRKYIKRKYLKQIEALLKEKIGPDYQLHDSNLVVKYNCFITSSKSLKKIPNKVYFLPYSAPLNTYVVYRDSVLAKLFHAKFPFHRRNYGYYKRFNELVIFSNKSYYEYNSAKNWLSQLKLKKGDIVCSNQNCNYFYIVIRKNGTKEFYNGSKETPLPIIEKDTTKIVSYLSLFSIRKLRSPMDFNWLNKTCCYKKDFTFPNIFLGFYPPESTQHFNLSPQNHQVLNAP